MGVGRTAKTLPVPVWHTSGWSPPQLLHSASRCCSPLCNPQSYAPAPEALPSLLSLSCTGRCPPLSLAGSASPFPVLTSLLSLLNTLARIHKGLCGQVSLGTWLGSMQGANVPGVRKKGGEGAPWEKEASSASTHFSEFVWGGGSYLGTPRGDHSLSRSEQACFSSAGCCIGCSRTSELLPPVFGSYSCPAPHTLLCVGPAP